MRQWGRRLLSWPAGAPGAAVLGELGWGPFSIEVQKLQTNLFGRLSSTSPVGVHRGLAARVFRYALRVPNSWAHATASSLSSAGITLPAAFGVVPGCAPRFVKRWKERCVRPALTTTSFRMRQAESSQLPSLATFFQCHPGLDFCSSIRSSRLPASLIREWTLARCGHHPFLDGRAARHRALHVPCLCGSDDWSLCHALRRCPIFSSLRSAWLQRLHSGWRMPDIESQRMEV